MIEIESGLGGALSGAATGAAIGSVIPGVGTAIGAGVGGLLGGATGAFSSNMSQELEGKQKWKDLPWYDRLTTSIAAKTEGALSDIAGVVGLDDYVGDEDRKRLADLQYERADDAGTSFQMGGGVTGAQGGQFTPQMNAGTSMPNQGFSLGKEIATEEEPALEQTNYNNNNFSF